MMNNDGIGDLARIAQVEIEGIKLGIELGKNAVKILKVLSAVVQSAVHFMMYDRKYIREFGKTNISNTLRKAGDAGVTFGKVQNKEQFKKLCKLAKKYGICISPVPSADGKEHFMYARKDAETVGEILDIIRTEEAKKAGKEMTQEDKEILRGEVDMEPPSVYVRDGGLLNYNSQQIEDKLKECYGKYALPMKVFEDEAKNSVETQKKTELNQTVQTAGKENERNKKAADERISVVEFRQEHIMDHDRDRNTFLFQIPGKENVFVELPGKNLSMGKDGMIQASISNDTEIYLCNAQPHDLENRTYMRERVTKQEFLKQIRKKETGNRKPKRGRDSARITINVALRKEEDEKGITTRVPGTYGDSVRYLWIPKEQFQYIDNEKTILSSLNFDEIYQLLDKDGKQAEMLSGKELYESYGKVSRRTNVKKGGEGIGKK